MRICSISAKTPDCSFSFVFKKDKGLYRHGFIELTNSQIILFKNVLKFLFDDPDEHPDFKLLDCKINIVFDHQFSVNRHPKYFGQRWIKRHFLDCKTDKNGFVEKENYSFRRLATLSWAKKIRTVVKRDSVLCDVLGADENFKPNPYRLVYTSFSHPSTKLWKSWKSYYNFFTKEDYSTLQLFLRNDMRYTTDGVMKFFSYFSEDEIKNYELNLSPLDYRFLKILVIRRGSQACRVCRQLYVFEYPDNIPENFINEWAIRSDGGAKGQYLFFKKI